MASLLLLISAAVGLGGSLGNDPAEAGLRARGWALIDQLSCENARPGFYYEISNEETTAEAYGLPGGGWLISKQPLPEAPYDCRAIDGPQFVEEIR